VNSTGRVIPKVATKPRSTIGQRIVGLPPIYRNATRTPPAPSAGRTIGDRSRVRNSANARMLTSVATVAAAIDQPEPTTPMRMPLTAGPMSPPMWKTLALRLTAVRRRGGSTICPISALRAGPSSDPATPDTAATR
jgi:hypothetical protein